MVPTSRLEDIRENIQYYNVSIPNSATSDTGIATTASFQEVRRTPLVEGYAEDYFLSVVRFSVPSAYIPVCFIPIQPYPNTNPNLTPLSVTLSYGGVDYQTFIIYYPQEPNATVPPAPRGPPGPPPAPQIPAEGLIRSNYLYYYGVFSYNYLVDMINRALQTSYNALIAVNPGVASAAPFMTFDSDTSLFSLHTPFTTSPSASYAPTLLFNSMTGIRTINPAVISIYFNASLYHYFDNSFDTLFYFGPTVTNGKNVLFIIEDTGVNTETLSSGSSSYFFTQECNTIAQISPLAGIVLTTGNLPIRTEWLSQYTPNPQFNVNNTNNFLRILSDFELDLLDGQESRNYIRYIPTAQYRYIDMIGKIPLDFIDINVYWKDTYNNLYNISIPFGQQVTIKILFEKKIGLPKVLGY